MPSIIQGYEYDIFISYRQKDNKQDGWVTEFINSLKNEIEATFKEDISIYFDENPFDGLGETHDVDDSLAKKLNCLIFIPIISQTYCDPNSFAWTNEFLAFNELASNDEYGFKVQLPNGNTATRVLPVRIHELDNEDNRLLENEIGFLRSIDFVYQEPGVNRPLKPEDNKEDNLNKTSYRNQINKVANAIKDIIAGIKTAGTTEESDAEETGTPKPKKIQLTSEIKRRNVLRASLVYILTSLVFWKVADIGIGLLNLPENTLQFIILALIIFFPIAMLMAWLYERSPQGFIKTGSAASRENPFSDAQKKPLTSNTFILLLVATVAALFVIYPQNDSSTATASEVIDKSIAVLPFKDMSPAGDQEYLGDGLAEEILNRLTKIPDLKVIGRTSSFQFKGDKIDLREIGNKLGVTTVLEGSVQKSGNRIRITAQLINVADGSHIWSDRYDRDMTDIFQLQDEIAKTITEKLKLTFLPVREENSNYQPNQEAYEMYLKGIYFLNRRGVGLLRAKDYFANALELDSMYALAYASLSQAYILIHYYEVAPPDGHVQKAIEFAQKAISLDENSAEAYASLGFINIFGLWDLDEAVKMLSKSLAINPNYSTARYWNAIQLGFNNKFEEGVDQSQLAIKNDPLSPIPYVVSSYTLIRQEKFEQALGQAKYSYELAPNLMANISVISNLVRLGRIEEALGVWEDTQRSKGNTIISTMICNLFYSLDETEKLNSLCVQIIQDSEVEYTSSLTLGVATWYAGARSKAENYLKEAVHQKNPFLIYYLNDLVFSYGADPELLAFIKKEVAAQSGQ